MNDTLNLEESALLAKMKSDLDRLKKKVQELEDEEEIAEDIESLIEQNANIVAVNVSEREIKFKLSDNRTIIVPIRWSWRLENASKDEWQNYEIIDDGNKVVWPDIEEEITVQGILTGDPAPRPD